MPHFQIILRISNNLGGQNMMIFGWILIGWVIYYFIKNGEFESKCKNSKSAEDILKERYVNGEIDEVTYNKMKMTINGK